MRCLTCGREYQKHCAPCALEEVCRDALHGTAFIRVTEDTFNRIKQQSFARENADYYFKTLSVPDDSNNGTRTLFFVDSNKFNIHTSGQGYKLAHSLIDDMPRA